MKVEVKNIISKLLHYLPDSAGHESPNWKWCWNELDDDGQEAVKQVRKEANKILKRETDCDYRRTK